MSTTTFRVQSNQGIDLGTFDASSAQGALDAMARDAGYESHAAACATTGEDPSDWTSDRYAFLGGAIGLLVTAA